MIGTRLGPYEITAKLGEGGMGVVYRAKDFHLGREVALKVLPAGFTADPERTARFEREAKLLAQLNHPNIAQIHGLEIQGDTRALVMEMVEGPTLADRLESGALPMEEGLSIARQIAEALEEAHEKGIIHRDLKPQNIKASLEGKVKVLDFGLAKAMDPIGASGMSPHDLAHSPTVTFGGTREGVILGTAAYMAPEQARGGAIDKRADIWAFGVVLYEMLSGRRLFAEGSVVDTLSAVMRKEIEFSQLPASVPPRLRELVRRCLERDPKRRLRDIGDARLELDAIAAGDTFEVRTGVAEAPSRRRTLRDLAVAAVALAIGAGLATLVARRSAPASTSEPIRIHPLTYSGSDSEPSASPDGKLIAFTSRRDGVPRIWIRQLVGGGEAPLTEGPDRLPRFSPDGSSVLFIRDLGSGQSVYRTALVGGEPRRIVDNATAADWSPDGQRIVFMRNSEATGGKTQIGAVEIASGAEKILTQVDDVFFQSPRWSPDGSSIAFASGSWAATDWSMKMLDVASGKVERIRPEGRSSPVGGLAWSGTGGALFYVQSPSDIGEAVGAPSAVMAADIGSGERRTLFWSEGLAWMNATARDIAQLDVLAPGRLLLGQRLRQQNLSEVTLRAAGQSVGDRSIANGRTIDRQPTYSPDGRNILFSSNRGGNLDLWSYDRATGALRQITDDPAQDWDPSYTPDGRQIVWDSDRETGVLEVWMADADGGNARQITHDGVSAQNPNMTRDGKWIVYWSGDPEKEGIWKIRPDGTEATILHRAIAALSEVSPDGTIVAYTEQDRLNLRNVLRFVDVESGNVLPFSIEIRYTLASPAVVWGRARWSGDGRSIFFLGENEQGRSGIYVQEFAPGRDTRATRRPVAGFSPDFITESFGLSPDGNHLTLSTGHEVASILVADGVPGAEPPARRGNS